MHIKKAHYVEKLITSHVLSPSIISLSDKLRDFFGDHALTVPNCGCDVTWPKSSVIDVVFFGDAFSQILNVAYWPSNPTFRLSFLCHSLKNAFADATGLDRNSLGVIPRYSLYPKKIPELRFPDLRTDPVDLIISSRFDDQKNIPHAVAFAERIALQNDRVKLYLCGPKFVPEKAQEVVGKFPGIRTIIAGDLRSGWLRQSYTNPVLIDFSTSFAEDFGVSIAEAQASGFSLILSAWGAHLDVSGDNVKVVANYRIPTATLEDLSAPRRVLSAPVKEESLQIFSQRELLSLAQDLKSKFGEDNLNFSNKGGAIAGPLKEILLRTYSEI